MLISITAAACRSKPARVLFSEGRLQVQPGRFNHQSTQESVKTLKGYKVLTEETGPLTGSAQSD